MKLEEMTLDVAQQIELKADIGDVFKSVLHRFGEGSTNPNGESMNMILEQWPGGRWFRDRGNGIGHLWGHVQVIKPPVLIELSGPMFMSYPALNHVEIKLDQVRRRHQSHPAPPLHRPARRNPPAEYRRRLETLPRQRHERFLVAFRLSCKTMANDLDPVWKALSDPTRRAILDLLHAGPRKTTEIVEAFPHLTRFGVMKHLDVLRDAGLVLTREEGRQRVNSLNAVPIRQIYERWVSRYQEFWADSLLRLQDDLRPKKK